MTFGDIWDRDVCPVHKGVYEGDPRVVSKINGENVLKIKSGFTGSKYIGPDWYSYLHELGRDGWELIAADGSAYLFKRPIE